MKNNDDRLITRVGISVGQRKKALASCRAVGVA